MTAPAIQARLDELAGAELGVELRRLEVEVIDDVIDGDANICGREGFVGAVQSKVSIWEQIWVEGHSYLRLRGVSVDTTLSPGSQPWHKLLDFLGTSLEIVQRMSGTCTAQADS